MYKVMNTWNYTNNLHNYIEKLKIIGRLLIT